jgi:arylsulfatase A-like enzyme
MFVHSTYIRKKLSNVVIIITDDQGWADIGYNNPDKVYTPNLDKLAAQETQWANHYVMPQCPPTRVSAFTGKYPGRFGRAALKASNNKVFPKGTPNLASMFKAAGYRTYLTGKWHMGSAPENGANHYGFDSSYRSITGAVGMYDHRYRQGKFYNTWHRDLVLIPNAENGIHATI